MRIFLPSTAAFENRLGGTQLRDIERDIARDRVVQHVARLALYRVDRGFNGGDQRWQVAGQRGAVLDRFDGGIDRAAGVVAKHHDQRRVEHRDGIFQACRHFVAGEIAGDAADENVAARGVEAIFGRDARVGAAEHSGVRILPCAQGFTLVLEVVTPAHPFDIARIASHQPVERGIGRNDVFRFRRRGGRRRKRVRSGRDRRAPRDCEL